MFFPLRMTLGEYVAGRKAPPYKWTVEDACPYRHTTYCMSKPLSYIESAAHTQNFM